MRPGILTHFSVQGPPGLSAGPRGGGCWRPGEGEAQPPRGSYSYKNKTSKLSWALFPPAPSRRTPGRERPQGRVWGSSGELAHMVKGLGFLLILFHFLI